jgi:hypothetical protein
LIAFGWITTSIGSLDPGSTTGGAESAEAVIVTPLSGAEYETVNDLLVTPAGITTDDGAMVPLGGPPEMSDGVRLIVVDCAKTAPDGTRLTVMSNGSPGETRADDVVTFRPVALV